MAREIRLTSRPVGKLSSDNVESVIVPEREPAPGEAQVRNLWMSVDPYMHGRIIDRASHWPLDATSKATLYGWRPQYRLREVLDGGAIGEVVVSNDAWLKTDDLVWSNDGWNGRFNAALSHLQKIEPRYLPPQAFLYVIRMPGPTAWLGLIEIAALKIWAEFPRAATAWHLNS